jgi:hypothetical protein
VKRWTLPGLGLALVLVLAALAGARAPGRAVVATPVDRVLVVSMPGVSWEDVERHDLPHLEAFLEEAAVGQLSTRIGRRGASTTDAYLTLGAGTRALAPPVDAAVALDPDETYAGVRTADVLLRRIGRVPDGVAYLAAGAAQQRNADGPFGGEPGRLGELLERAGVGRAVVANADAAEGFPSDEPPPDGAYARSAATMLMGAEGIVPGGTVGRGLLTVDPAAPFGRRLDHEAVLRAAAVAWSEGDRGVLVVEASDLARASAYRPRATPAQGRELRSDALRTSDALLGALLDDVAGPEDAVLVLSPVADRASPELAIVALRTPATTGGVLRSATTRRDGYVQLADVAPTVLRLLGEEVPSDIEGRPFEVSPRPAGARVAELADEADAAGFRDGLMPVVVPLVIGFLALLVAVAWSPRSERLRRLVAPAAHGALGVVPVSFGLAQVPAVTGSTAAYLLALAAGAAAVGTATWLIDRWRPGLGTIAAVGLLVLLFSVDVLAGAPLQVNAVFGYSVAVAGRFAGIGNLAFALFGAAAVLLAALAADRWGERVRPALVALLVAIVLLEGLPMLGADVGGVLSMVPAFLVVGLILHGRRVGPAQVLLAVAAAGAAVLTFAFVDTARPEGERTHLSRLADHLLDGRGSSFADSLSRRLQASFGDAEGAAWLLVLALVALVGAYVIGVARGLVVPGRPSARRPRWLDGRPARAALAGLAVLAALGLVANDSSIAVPATMLIVVVPVAVLHRQRAEVAS